MVMRQVEFSSEEQLADYLDFLETVAIPTLNEDLSVDGLEYKKKNMVSFSRYQNQLESSILKYTLGYELESVSEACLKCIEYLEYYTSVTKDELDAIPELYLYIVWTLALASLFDLDIGELKGRVPFVGKDMLIDRLYYSFDPRSDPSRSILFQKLNKDLCLAIGSYDDNDRLGHIDTYLSNYFGALKQYEVSWFDSHKETDPDYFTHFGYWVFELAALVKMLNWDDSEISDHPLYPRELVDWHRNN